MRDILAWVLSGILVENVILARFFGTCPFLGVSKKRSSATGMGFAVTFVITISSVASWLLYKYVLVPMEMAYMRTIVFILVIASLVQILEMFIKKVSPALYRSLGIYLPLITTNCAILGMASVVTMEQFTFLKTLIYSFASGVGFLLVIYIFSSLREKLERAPIPKPFQGVPIAFIIAGIMAMIFARFAGVV
ncbi:MAG TPA: RnfABCDGE type electron transport complex subunit A [Acholeplasmataceae bacterium]|jgi:electron transport complex protein RnfA|nr:RnfABCDGE type electron transport complex subunit A [Acholeplasmataceae bacterium]